MELLDRLMKIMRNEKYLACYTVKLKITKIGTNKEIIWVNKRGKDVAISYATQNLFKRSFD